MKEIRYLYETCSCGQSRLPTVCQRQCSPYHLPRRISQHHRLDIIFTGIVVPLENGKGLVAGNCHDPFVIPSFPYLSSHKGMTEIMKAQVRHNSVSKKSDSRFRS